ncbi:MAG: response regulator [Romboutsia sp.]|uniref:response regulator transcription factor n=1 Tax=Romboutsia sp. TaxID=1965302 RepID=UPI003F3B2E4C
MYNVYLLDDEPFILEGLKYIVPWEEYGFKIVGSANNGEDGYNEIINKKVDLVITDIMMPKMTGLELISKLKEHDYHLDFIVLSAFQEFKYAKKAINIGAVDYLLKPIDTDELSRNLKIIYNKLKEKDSINLDNNIIKNDLLLKLVQEKNNTNIKIKLREFGVEITNNKISVAIIEIQNTNNDIGNILKEINKDYNFKYCIESKSRAILIIEEESKDLIINRLTNIKNQIANMSNDIVYISLGNEVEEVNNLHISYENAKQISEYKIVCSDVSWIKEYKDYSNKKVMYIQFEELKKMLMNKDFSKTSSYVNDMLRELKEDEELSPKQIKMKALEVFLNVYNYFNESKLTKGLNVYLENVINNNTVSEIELELVNMIKYMQSKLEQTEESISPVILKLLQHIEESYKYDLNLKEISDNLNINSIYLGQLFQKETGVLFSDYINNFRINKAKDLLVNTSLKASEIGDLVGYANKNYFYRKFKNIVGITPSEWRKINI